jgi:hypothetical protein
LVTFKSYYEDGSIKECDIRSSFERSYWNTDLIERTSYRVDGTVHNKKKLVGDTVVEERYDNNGNVTSKTETILDK